MRLGYLCAALTAGFLLMPGSADAACSLGGGDFFFSGDRIVISLKTDSQPCRFRYNTERSASGVVIGFNSIRATTSPQHGTLKLDKFAVIYQPTTDYSGQDRFVIALCGELRGGFKGCSDLVYDVVVK